MTSKNIAGQHWAIWSASDAALQNQLQQLTARQFDEAAPYGRTRDGFNHTEMIDGVAVVRVAGVMMKHTTASQYRFGAISTCELREDIRLASHADNVKQILLRVESPGGIAAGTAELFDEIQAAATRKPLWAFIEDIGASAAYWAACGASKVFTNRTGKVGSIGTYAVIQDFSAMAEKEGVKVHVIRAGTHKGAGVPGTRLTDEELAEFQRVVDATNEHFIAGVATGRGVQPELARQWSDGRVHVGQDAAELGLVDGVQSYEQTLDEIRGRTLKQTSKRSNPQRSQPTNKGQQPAMTNATTAWNDAVTAEIQNGLSRADAIAKVNRKHPGLRERFLAERAEQTSNNGGGPLTAPVQQRQPAGGTTGNATAEWNAAIDTEMQAGRSKAEAIAKVNRKHPGLRERFLAEANG